jgi:hypothetical protein
MLKPISARLANNLPLPRFVGETIPQRAPYAGSFVAILFEGVLCWAMVKN